MSLNKLCSQIISEGEPLVEVPSFWALKIEDRNALVAAYIREEWMIDELDEAFDLMPQFWLRETIADMVEEKADVEDFQHMMSTALSLYLADDIQGLLDDAHRDYCLSNGLVPIVDAEFEICPEPRG